MIKILCFVSPWPIIDRMIIEIGEKSPSKSHSRLVGGMIGWMRQKRLKAVEWKKIKIQKK